MDRGVTKPLYGNYRAKVVDNKDKQQFGRVFVWIPDLMPELDSTKDGIWARPANNPMGGRNLEGGSQSENFYAGTSYIPKVDSWVWIFFEKGNINFPYYFGALDLENTRVLPENQLGSNFEDKWTVFKSHQGRTIIISDDPDDARVEITGKKRKLANSPTGDLWSVTGITGNQTTILMDERNEQEKILIKTYKGDYININIEERSVEIEMAGDIHIKHGGNLYVSTKGDMHFLSAASIHMTAKDEINIVSGHRFNIESGEEFNKNVLSNSVEKCGGKKIMICSEEYYRKSGGEQHIKAGGNINTDAPKIYDNSGQSQEPDPVTIQAVEATPATPDGSRTVDTDTVGE
jgi:hypothetical protein